MVLLLIGSFLTGWGGWRTRLGKVVLQDEGTWRTRLGERRITGRGNMEETGERRIGRRGMMVGKMDMEETGKRPLYLASYEIAASTVAGNGGYRLLSCFTMITNHLESGVCRDRANRDS